MRYHITLAICFFLCGADVQAENCYQKWEPVRLACTDKPWGQQNDCDKRARYSYQQCLQNEQLEAERARQAGMTEQEKWLEAQRQILREQELRYNQQMARQRAYEAQLREEARRQQSRMIWGKALQDVGRNLSGYGQPQQTMPMPYNHTYQFPNGQSMRCNHNPARGFTNCY